MDGVVYALAVVGTNLYAGGSFLNAGGISSKYMAKWNGTAWSALGGGLNDVVYTLAVIGTDLYAGGSFSGTPGLSANKVAKWNGSAWSGLGTNISIDGRINSLTVNGSDLYAGGQFTSIGGVTMNRLAKWDGTSWTTFGTGVNNHINSIAVFGTDLYMGGYFTTANGIISNYFAQWHDDLLPVELSSFTSSVNANKVKLNWSTVMEENNSGFDVERKLSNENNWNKISFINGNGTSNIVHNYSYQDKNLLSGKYNYRLKQVDFNGNYKYYDLSSEVIIGTPNRFRLNQNYPNPFNPTTKINFELPNSGFITLSIFDISGREVKQLVNETKPAGYYSVVFDAKGLSSGAYFYKLTGDNFSDTKKMVLVK